MIYKLSKYNPNYRTNGVYTHDEWTSVSDIGGTFETGRFTGLQYIETEAQYVLCLEALVGERNQSEFLIRDYERSGMLPLFTAVRLTLALRSGLYFFRGLSGGIIKLLKALMSPLSLWIACAKDAGENYVVRA